VVLYSPRIFNKAGIKDRNHLLIAFWLPPLLDRVGRRSLLLTSLAGMFISLAMLGVGLTVIEHTSEKLVWAIALSISTVFTFVAFFSVGLGPITWFYSSEIFLLRLKPREPAWVWQLIAS
jgi:MFS family permease